MQVTCAQVPERHTRLNSNIFPDKCCALTALNAPVQQNTKELIPFFLSHGYVFCPSSLKASIPGVLFTSKTQTGTFLCFLEKGNPCCKLNDLAGFLFDTWK